jgi:hypothetical protein
MFRVLDTHPLCKWTMYGGSGRESVRSMAELEDRRIGAEDRSGSFYNPVTCIPHLTILTASNLSDLNRDKSIPLNSVFEDTVYLSYLPHPNG